MLRAKAGVAAALPQAPGGLVITSSSLPPDSVTHDGFKVPPLPKHRTQSLPSALGVGACPQPAGGAACSGAAEEGAAAGERAAAGHAAAQQLPCAAPGPPPCWCLRLGSPVFHNAHAALRFAQLIAETVICLQCAW